MIGGTCGGHREASWEHFTAIQLPAVPYPWPSIPLVRLEEPWGEKKVVNNGK